VEFLGESFNRMIQALADSQREISLRTTELEAAVRRAHESTAAQTDCLAGLSRQMGTPLNEMAEILDQNAGGAVGNPESRDQLQSAQQSADTLLALLNHLLSETSHQAARIC
jgi:signal transduction histidine kinase